MNWLIGLSIGAALAALLVARNSAAKDPVHGSIGAKSFHFLAAALFASSLPTVLATLIVNHGLLNAFVSGLVCVGSSFALLLIYAAFESPARAALPNEDDTAWTAEKARQSGL